jgi:hypothetical protein
MKFRYRVYPPLGRSFDPRVAVIKDTPGPMLMVDRGIDKGGESQATASKMGGILSVASAASKSSEWKARTIKHCAASSPATSFRRETPSFVLKRAISAIELG